MRVLKFGGSSVADATRISGMLDIVLSASTRDRIILVCSAIKGCTDELIAKGDLTGLQERHHAIIRRLFTGEQCSSAIRECDELFSAIPSSSVPESYGEILSTRIIERKLASEGYDTLWLDSRELVIKGDLARTYENISRKVEANPDVRIFVAPGFIASDGNGRVTTLGRGGSDYSAAIYAAAVKADSLQIWTDVPGIMTANPAEVKAARTIPQISYETARMLADHGAKVLYPPTVDPARKAGIPIDILSSFSPKTPGTVIKADVRSRGWIGVTGVAEGDEAVIFIAGNGEETPGDIEQILHRSQLSVLSSDRAEGGLIVRVPLREYKEALRTIHFSLFELSSCQDIFLAGCGKVGSALLEAIEATGQKVNIRAVSRTAADDEAFFAELLSQPRHSAVFVDCTDSETIYEWYVPVLEAGINIVSSNRRALSVPYAEYAAMKRAAKLNHCTLRYETTVGAALPILESIAMSANSDDEILSIQAVVSCTLNYIFSSPLSFDEALAKAREIGLTEKDPSQDLQGRDALRKLLILAREAGIPLEESHVEIKPVGGKIPGVNQRFVASVEKDSSSGLGYRATIELRTVEPSHPAYWLCGTDNAIMVRSAYHPTPLVIQGAGEGARQAASSVLNDILK